MSAWPDEEAGELVTAYGRISLRRHGFVRELVLDRAEALNALSTAMAGELAAACAEVAADASARAVVVTSASERAFSVGADLKERNGFSDADLMAQRPVFRAAFTGLLELPQPTVAAVHGFAVGGGLEFALSCDIVVADETALLGLPEVTVGLVPGGGGTQLVRRRVGAARAADLVLTGRRVPAGEARDLGLIDRLVPPGRDRAIALGLAQTIAANSPVATRAAKRALRLGADVDLRTGLDVEDAAWRTAAFSADRKEGIPAFNDKRSPDWPGK